jgi:nucleoside phosphorylase
MGIAASGDRLARMEPASPPVDLLVFGAHPGTLRGLREHLGDRLDGSIRGFRVTAKTIGVGMGVAGGLAAKRVYQLAPRAVVLLGTCGVYGGVPGYQPYDVVVGSAFHLVDLGVLRGESAFPQPMQTEVRPHATLSVGLAAALPRARQVSVASPLAETIDDESSARIPQVTGCEVESLEAFSVAQVCSMAQVPFAGVFGVSHVAGSTALTDWRNFERQCCLAAAEALVGWVQMNMPGLPAY